MSDKPRVELNPNIDFGGFGASPDEAPVKGDPISQERYFDLEMRDETPNLDNIDFGEFGKESPTEYRDEEPEVDPTRSLFDDFVEAMNSSPFAGSSALAGTLANMHQVVMHQIPQSAMGQALALESGAIEGLVEELESLEGLPDSDPYEVPISIPMVASGAYFPTTESRVWGKGLRNEPPPTTVGARRAWLEERLGKQKDDMMRVWKSIAKNKEDDERDWHAAQLRDIRSPEDMAGWLGGALGSILPQALISMALPGINSYIMESGLAYIEQVEELAEKYGITPEEVIEQELDSYAISAGFGVAQTALDMVGLGAQAKVLKKLLTPNQASKQVYRDWGMAMLKEGGTEPFQSFLKDTGINIALDNTLQESYQRYRDNLWGYFEEGLSAAVGTGLMGSPTLGLKSHNARVAAKSAQYQKEVHDLRQEIITKSDALDEVDEKILKLQQEELQASKDGETLDQINKDLNSTPSYTFKDKPITREDAISLAQDGQLQDLEVSNDPEVEGIIMDKYIELSRKDVVDIETPAVEEKKETKPKVEKKQPSTPRVTLAESFTEQIKEGTFEQNEENLKSVNRVLARRKLTDDQRATIQGWKDEIMTKRATERAERRKAKQEHLKKQKEEFDKKKAEEQARKEKEAPKPKETQEERLQKLRETKPKYTKKTTDEKYAEKKLEDVAKPTLEKLANDETFSRREEAQALIQKRKEEAEIKKDAKLKATEDARAEKAKEAELKKQEDEKAKAEASMPVEQRVEKTEVTTDQGKGDVETLKSVRKPFTILRNVSDKVKALQKQIREEKSDKKKASLKGEIDQLLSDTDEQTTNAAFEAQEVLNGITINKDTESVVTGLYNTLQKELDSFAKITKSDIKGKAKKIAKDNSQRKEEIIYNAQVKVAELEEKIKSAKDAGEKAGLVEERNNAVSRVKRLAEGFIEYRENEPLLPKLDRQAKINLKSHGHRQGKKGFDAKYGEQREDKADRTVSAIAGAQASNQAQGKTGKKAEAQRAKKAEKAVKTKESDKKETVQKESTKKEKSTTAFKTKMPSIAKFVKNGVLNLEKWIDAFHKAMFSDTQTKQTEVDGIPIDAELAPSMGRIWKLGIVSLQSDSGSTIDHVEKENRSGNGYIAFPTEEALEESTHKLAGKNKVSGLSKSNSNAVIGIIEEVASKLGFKIQYGETFLKPSMSVILPKGISDAEVSKMWNKLADNLEKALAKEESVEIEAKAPAVLEKIGKQKYVPWKDLTEEQRSTAVAGNVGILQELDRELYDEAKEALEDKDTPQQDVQDIKDYIDSYEFTLFERNQKEQAEKAEQAKKEEAKKTKDEKVVETKKKKGKDYSSYTDKQLSIERDRVEKSIKDLNVPNKYSPQEVRILTKVLGQQLEDIKEEQKYRKTPTTGGEKKASKAVTVSKEQAESERAARKEYEATEREARLRELARKGNTLSVFSMEELTTEKELLKEKIEYLESTQEGSAQTRAMARKQAKQRLENINAEINRRVETSKNALQESVETQTEDKPKSESISKIAKSTRESREEARQELQNLKKKHLEAKIKQLQFQIKAASKFKPSVRKQIETRYQGYIDDIKAELSDRNTSDMERSMSTNRLEAQEAAQKAKSKTQHRTSQKLKEAGYTETIEEGGDIAILRSEDGNFAVTLKGEPVEKGTNIKSLDDAREKAKDAFIKNMQDIANDPDNEIIDPTATSVSLRNRKKLEFDNIELLTSGETRKILESATYLDKYGKPQKIYTKSQVDQLMRKKAEMDKIMNGLGMETAQVYLVDNLTYAGTDSYPNGVHVFDHKTGQRFILIRRRNAERTGTLTSPFSIGKTIAHEIVHSFTVPYLRTMEMMFLNYKRQIIKAENSGILSSNPELRPAYDAWLKVIRYMNEARQKIDPQYAKTLGLTNPSEFAAELLSNPLFARELAKIEAHRIGGRRGENAFQTIANQVFDFVKKLFGLSDSTANNLYMASIDALAELDYQMLGNPDVFKALMQRLKQITSVNLEPAGQRIVEGNKFAKLGSYTVTAKDGLRELDLSEIGEYLRKGSILNRRQINRILREIAFRNEIFAELNLAPVQVYIVDSVKQDGKAVAGGFTANSRNGGVIFLSKEGLKQEGGLLTLHEVVHLFTAMNIRLGEHFSQKSEWEKLSPKAQQHFAKFVELYRTADKIVNKLRRMISKEAISQRDDISLHFAAQSPDELIAEAFSNPTVARWLNLLDSGRKIPLTDASYSSMFVELMEAVEDAVEAKDGAIYADTPLQELYAAITNVDGWINENRELFTELIKDSAMDQVNERLGESELNRSKVNNVRKPMVSALNDYATRLKKAGHYNFNWDEWRANVREINLLRKKAGKSLFTYEEMLHVFRKMDTAQRDRQRRVRTAQELFDVFMRDGDIKAAKEEIIKYIKKSLPKIKITKQEAHDLMNAIRRADDFNSFKSATSMVDDILAGIVKRNEIKELKDQIKKARKEGVVNEHRSWKRLKKVKVDDLPNDMFQQLKSILKNPNENVEALKIWLEEYERLSAFVKNRDYNALLNMTEEEIAELEVEARKMESAKRTRKINKLKEESKKMRHLRWKANETKKMILATKIDKMLKGRIDSTQDDIKAFLMADVRTMGLKELELYDREMRYLLKNGELTDKAFRFIIEVEKERKIQELLGAVKRVDKSVQSSMGTNSAALITTRMAHHDKRGANKLFEVFFGYRKGDTDADLALKEEAKAIYDIAEKNNLGNKNFKRVQMYGSIFTTNSQSFEFEYNDEIQDNIDRQRKAILTKIKSIENKEFKGMKLKEAQEELELFDELVEAIKKDPNTALTKGEMEYHSHRLAMYDALYDEVKHVANVHLAKGIDRLNNFVPLNAQGKDDSAGAEFNAENAISAEQLLGGEYKRPKNIKGNANKHMKARTGAKGVFYNNNALEVDAQYLRGMLYDVRVTRELNIINAISKDDRVRQLLGNKNMSTLTQYIKSSVESARRTKVELPAVIKFLEKMKTSYVVAQIGNIKQFFIQYMTMLKAQIITDPKLTTNAAKMLMSGKIGGIDANEWFNKHGAGIQIRNIRFEEYNTRDDFKDMFGKLGKMNRKAEEITTGVLRWSDALAAKTQFLIEFEKAGGDFNNPKKEHILAAERVTDLKHNISNARFAPKMFLHSRDVAWERRAIASMLFMFRTHAMNQAMTSIHAARQLSGDEAKGMLAYQSINAAAYRMISTALGIMFSHAFGYADEEDDWSKIINPLYILSNTLADLGLGASPSFIENEVKVQLNRLAKATITDKELFWTDDTYTDALGGYGVFIGNISDRTKKLQEIFESDGEITKEHLFLFLEDIMMWSSLMNVPVPMRGDMARIFRELKKGERENPTESVIGGKSKGRFRR